MQKLIISSISLLLLLLFITNCSDSPTSPEPDNPEIVTGTVLTDTISGVLGIENSPYIIRGRVTVPEDSTLLIKPGVKIYFKSSENDEDFDYDNLNVGMLEVNGFIQAEGRIDSTITFSRANEKGYWGMIFIQSNDTNEVSSFDYCNFEYGNKAEGIPIDDPRFGTIMTNYSKVEIENSIVQNSKKNGIVCYYSIAYVKNNTICDNQDEGITCYSTTVEILSNLFQNNTEIAILLHSYSDGIINDNVIIGDGSGWYNDGICLYKSTSIITNNSISSCGGTGVYIFNYEYINYGSPIDIIISGNLITNNFTGIDLSCRYGIYPIISENTISNNNSTGITISLSNDCKIDVYNNLIENNGGTGIFAQNISELMLKDNVISNNSLEGIYCRYCDLVNIFLNEIYMNGYEDDSYYSGLCISSSNSNVTNNLIALNGIGVSSFSSKMNIINCDILDNKTAIYTSGINNDSDVINSIIHNNDLSFEFSDNYAGTVEMSYSLVQDSIPAPELTDLGNNLLAVDPQFVDEENNNYQLSASSPCIDMGTNAIDSLPEFDLLGNPRIVGSSIDIGAYEFQVGK